MKSLLIVDDDPINNIITKKRFSAVPNLKLVVFESGSEALNYIQNTPTRPNLVLLDLNMPHVTGWDFLNQCQESDILLRVVILSSSIDQRNISKSKTYANVLDFISKPLTKDKADYVRELL